MFLLLLPSLPFLPPVCEKRETAFGKRGGRPPPLLRSSKLFLLSRLNFTIRRGEKRKKGGERKELRREPSSSPFFRRVHRRRSPLLSGPIRKQCLYFNETFLLYYHFSSSLSSASLLCTCLQIYLCRSLSHLPVPSSLFMGLLELGNGDRGVRGA